MPLKYKILFNYLNKKIPKAGYQILRLGDCFICSRDIDFDVTKRAISNTGTCGISKNLELAKIKAISEFVEREAVKNSNAQSSTGFAAYPFIFNAKKAHNNAKLNAFNEMLERYALFNWANNDNIKNTVSNTPYKENKNIYLAIQKEIKFIEYHKIFPNLSDAQGTVFVILYTKTKYGWAFGSAANKCAIQAEMNALKELYMHCVGLYRILEKQIPAKSHNEKQILWVSQQEALIKNKIKVIGNDSIQIPEPLFKTIKSKHHDCYTIQQCYFKEYNQDLNKDFKILYI